MSDQNVPQVEEWRPVVGLEECYEVSSLGRIMSKDRTERCGSMMRRRRGRILKPYVNSCGYLRVDLVFKDNPRMSQPRYRYGVHQVVAIAFIPNPDGKPQVNHINCDKFDNRVCNLEWATAKENQSHSVRSGTFGQMGRKNIFNKLNEDQVREIRQSSDTSAMAKKHGISFQAAWRIKKRKSWKWLP